MLKDYLIERNLPLCIWLSEDGTRLTGKIEYDSLTNKVIGFVLPFINGCAQVNSFEATSAYKIIENFQNNIKSDYAYVFMAQPLSDSTPPFCVSIFGTDNRLNYSDVIARWKKINQMASEIGITILGFSSDRDTRLLKAMQIKAYSQTEELQNLCSYYIQDTVHIGTKLRTRILKQNKTIQCKSVITLYQCHTYMK